MTVVAALLGAGMAAGVILIVVGLKGQRDWSCMRSGGDSDTFLDK